MADHLRNIDRIVAQSDALLSKIQLSRWKGLESSSDVFLLIWCLVCK